jgi:hypothetical protein
LRGLIVETTWLPDPSYVQRAVVCRGPQRRIERLMG